MRALGAALKPANLRVYPQIIATETKKYFDSKWGNEGTADIHQVFADLIIQTGSATLMGPEIQNELFDEMFRLYQDLDKGLTPFSVFFPYAPTPAHARRDKARKAVVDLFSGIINRRRADPEAAKSNQDLVQRLMEFSYTDGSKFTDEEIAGMMIATLFAAQHTSNVTATWTTLFLLEDARNGGDYLQRALDEMRKVEPELGAFREGRGIDHKVLAEQNWLYSCVKEAIRMFPPLIFLLRRALNDIQVTDDIFIPKGHLAMVSNAVAQRLPEVFERPDEYLPDRWATWDITKLPKFSFIGFGAGLHTCMGESFAFLQVRTILDVLLTNFELELTTPFPTPDYESIVVIPHGPNIVRYKRRTNPLQGSSSISAPVQQAQVQSQPKLDFEDNITKRFTRAEVAKHTFRDDLWIIVNNKVYDITTYVPLHQGGEQALLNVAGGEATAQVEGPQHPGTVPTLLSRFQIGVLSD
jgi:sterol 14-demethylase